MPLRTPEMPLRLQADGPPPGRMGQLDSAVHEPRDGASKSAPSNPPDPNDLVDRVLDDHRVALGTHRGIERDPHRCQPFLGRAGHGQKSGGKSEQ